MKSKSSHIYVTESTPQVIFIPTRIIHNCSGGGDFRQSSPGDEILERDVAYTYMETTKL